jgi:hypothetical protein
MSAMEPVLAITSITPLSYNLINNCTAANNNINNNSDPIEINDVDSDIYCSSSDEEMQLSNNSNTTNNTNHTNIISINSHFASSNNSSNKDSRDNDSFKPSQISATSYSSSLHGTERNSNSSNNNAKISPHTNHTVSPAQSTSASSNSTESCALQFTDTFSDCIIPEDLTCTICFSLLTSPLKLVCGHSFCQDCLINWAKSSFELQEESRKANTCAYGLLDSELGSENWPRISTELSEGNRCEVCLMICQNDDDLVICEGCDIKVHQYCYMIPEIPANDWFCDACVANSPIHQRRCVLCPNTEDRVYKAVIGAIPPDNSQISKLKNGQHCGKTAWIHVSCANWHNSINFINLATKSPITGLEKICRGLFSLKCTYCKAKGAGACLQCSYGRCMTAYHVACAFRAGVKFEMRNSDHDGVINLSFCPKHRENSAEIDGKSNKPKPKSFFQLPCPHCRQFTRGALRKKLFSLKRAYKLSDKINSFKQNQRRITGTSAPNEQLEGIELESTGEESEYENFQQNHTPSKEKLPAISNNQGENSSGEDISNSTQLQQRNKRRRESSGPSSSIRRSSCLNSLPIPQISDAVERARREFNKLRRTLKVKESEIVAQLESAVQGKALPQLAVQLLSNCSNAIQALQLKL